MEEQSEVGVDDDMEGATDMEDGTDEEEDNDSEDDLLYDDEDDLKAEDDNWILFSCPRNDVTVPKTRGPRRAHVRKLIVAVKNNVDTVEKPTNKTYQTRWKDGAKHYSAANIEKLCWRVLGDMMDLYTGEGWYYPVDTRRRVRECGAPSIVAGQRWPFRITRRRSGFSERATTTYSVPICPFCRFCRACLITIVRHLEHDFDRSTSACTH
jgi:hypothetical protein